MLKNVDLSKTVLHAPMDRDKLITCLRSALDVMYPASERQLQRQRQRHGTIKSSSSPRIRYNDHADSIKLFDEFLSEIKGNINGIIPDESLMAEFMAFLDVKKAHWGIKPRQNISTNIRNLINAMPSSLLQRILLPPKDHKRATRFHCFSKETQKIISHFAQSSRKLQKRRYGDPSKPTLSSTSLSQSTRNTRIEQLQLFLRLVGKDCVFSLTDSDADRYLEHYTEHDIEQTGINNLCDLQSFFTNLVASGTLEKSPITKFYYKKNNVDDDFVPPDQLAILQNLSKVNLKDFAEVRDRLLAFCLCYDFSLRIGEVARLKVSDVVISDCIELTIRNEIQKGDKSTKLAYSFFPESKTLMTAYLNLRKKRLHDTATDTDALILSEHSERMLDNGCRNRIQNLCMSLKIKTFKGNVPAPHRFRHSFGTCNVAPLGLNLGIYDIMTHLRHTSIELTTRTYITDNPLLNKAKHDAHLKAHRNLAVQQNRLDRNSIQNGFNNRHVQPQSNVIANPSPSPSPAFPFSPPQTPSTNDFSLPENDALKLLAPFEITRQALRKYAEAQGMVEENGKDYFYSNQFIQDLSNNYMTKQEAMETVGLRKSGYFYWMSSKGIEAVVIGKASLLKKDDVLARNREEKLKKTA